MAIVITRWKCAYGGGGGGARCDGRGVGEGGGEDTGNISQQKIKEV